MHDTEAGAIEALRSGDISGLEVLVRLHQVQAMRVAYVICNDTQLAEDVVADAFLAAQRSIHTYDAARPFEPWFYRIVINGVRAALRQQSRFHATLAAGTVLEDRPDPSLSPEAYVLRSELASVLIRALADIPKAQREVVVLRYYLDMDERGIAALLSVPLGTVKWRLYRARKQLQRRLATIAEIRGYFSQEGEVP